MLEMDITLIRHSDSVMLIDFNVPGDLFQFQNSSTKKMKENTKCNLESELFFLRLQQSCRLTNVTNSLSRYHVISKVFLITQSSVSYNSQEVKIHERQSSKHNDLICVCVYVFDWSNSINTSFNIFR